MTYEKYELEHAIRYANELAKIYNFEKYSKTFPYLFKHATLETRPATSKDYYVPQSIAQKCIVVAKTTFDEMGCKKVACFEYKGNLEPCEKNDPARWIPIGKGFTLACQPACRYEGAFDTDYRNGTCVLSNHYKKIFALFPESVSGMESKHDFHTGLDIANGQIRLNDWYCESYGLDFDDGDCYSSVGQTIGEIFLGSTVYRGIFKTRTRKSSQLQTPPIPDYILNFPKPARKKRSMDSLPDFGSIAEDMAIEMSADYGVDISVEVVQKILRKRVPSLISKATNLPVKHAMIQAVLKSHAMMAINISKALATGLSAASGVWTLFGIMTFVLDIFDPFEYNRVLDKETVQKFNRQLDWKFYRTERVRDVEVTPEYFCENVLIDEDQSDLYEFVSEKIDEYMTALNQLPKKPGKKFFRRVKPKKKSDSMNYWNFVVHTIIILSIVGLSITWINNIHVIALLTFFFFVLINPVNY